MDTQPREQLSLREALGGDPEQVLAEHIQFGKDREYLDSITPQLREEHPDRLVVVYKEQVVAIVDDLEELRSELDHLGIPKGASVIRLIEKEPKPMIL